MEKPLKGFLKQEDLNLDLHHNLYAQTKLGPHDHTILLL